MAASKTSEATTTAANNAAAGTVVDVNVVGAGLVGLATAVELAHHGHRVRVIDPTPGAGATHHAGGMLAPAAEVVYQQDPLFPLMQTSAKWYPQLIDIIADNTDKPTGYRTNGTVVVAADRADSIHLRELMDYQKAHGMEVEKLPVRQARRLEPGLSPALAGAVHLPGDHQIMPRQTVPALLDALKNLDAEIVSESACSIDGATVHTDSGTYPAEQTVLCNGLGARKVSGWYADTNPLALRPVYGDVVQLRCPQHLYPLCERVIRGFVTDRPIYIIPRLDGTITIGATSREDHSPNPPAFAVADLLRDAIRVLPGIEECDFIEASTGARPGTPNDLPYLGRISDKLVVSTGYFRHGILLTALAARTTRELIEHDEPSIDLAACDPLRDRTD